MNLSWEESEHLYDEELFKNSSSPLQDALLHRRGKNLYQKRADTRRLADFWHSWLCIFKPGEWDFC